MKNMNRPTPVKKNIAVRQGHPLREKLEQWCQKHHTWIIITILAVSLLIRIVYFQQCGNTHFVHEHANVESDMAFFNEGALKITEGDLLSQTIGHPRVGKIRLLLQPGQYRDRRW